MKRTIAAVAVSTMLMGGMLAPIYAHAAETTPTTISQSQADAVGYPELANKPRSTGVPGLPVLSPEEIAKLYRPEGALLPSEAKLKNGWGWILPDGREINPNAPEGYYSVYAVVPEDGRFRVSYTDAEGVTHSNVEARPSVFGPYIDSIKSQWSLGYLFRDGAEILVNKADVPAGAFVETDKILKGWYIPSGIVTADPKDMYPLPPKWSLTVNENDFLVRFTEDLAGYAVKARVEWKVNGKLQWNEQNAASQFAKGGVWYSGPQGGVVTDVKVTFYDANGKIVASDIKQPPAPVVPTPTVTEAPATEKPVDPTPTDIPTIDPTTEPTDDVTPTDEPTVDVTPTEEPTTPVVTPTDEPTIDPTDTTPTPEPTDGPTTDPEPSTPVETPVDEETPVTEPTPDVTETTPVEVPTAEPTPTQTTPAEVTPEPTQKPTVAPQPPVQTVQPTTPVHTPVAPAPEVTKPAEETPAPTETVVVTHPDPVETPAPAAPEPKPTNVVKPKPVKTAAPRKGVITKRIVQVDDYYVKPGAEADRVARYKLDGVLKYREDKEQWNDSRWSIQEQTFRDGKLIHSRVLKRGGNATAANTRGKVKVTQVYRLNKRASVSAPWGANKKLDQVFVFWSTL